MAAVMLRGGRIGTPRWRGERQEEGEGDRSLAYWRERLSPTPPKLSFPNEAASPIESFEGAYAYLLAQGVRAQPPKVAPYGMKQLYASDPDGYELCFQWSAEQAKERS